LDRLPTRPDKAWRGDDTLPLVGPLRLDPRGVGLSDWRHGGAVAIPQRRRTPPETLWPPLAGALGM